MKFNTVACWGIWAWGLFSLCWKGERASIGVVEKTVQPQLSLWKRMEKKVASALCDCVFVSIQSVNYRKPPQGRQRDRLFPRVKGSNREGQCFGTSCASSVCWAKLSPAGLGTGPANSYWPYKIFEKMWLPQSLPQGGAYNSSLSKGLQSLTF